jgi:hypothetical protein
MKSQCIRQRQPRSLDIVIIEEGQKSKQIIYALLLTVGCLLVVSWRILLRFVSPSAPRRSGDLRPRKERRGRRGDMPETKWTALETFAVPDYYYLLLLRRPSPTAYDDENHRCGGDCLIQTCNLSPCALLANLLASLSAGPPIPKCQHDHYLHHDFCSEQTPAGAERESAAGTDRVGSGQ